MLMQLLAGGLGGAGGAGMRTASAFFLFRVVLGCGGLDVTFLDGFLPCIVLCLGEPPTQVAHLLDEAVQAAEARKRRMSMDEAEWQKNRAINILRTSAIFEGIVTETLLGCRLLRVLYSCVAGHHSRLGFPRLGGGCIP